MYVLECGEKFDKIKKFKFKKVTFKIVSEVLPIFEKIDKINEVDSSEAEGLKYEKGNISDLGQLTRYSNSLKKIISKDDFIKLYDLYIELIQKTIVFDKTTEVYENEIMGASDTEFWENQSVEGVKTGISYFRKKIS